MKVAVLATFVIFCVVYFSFAGAHGDEGSPEAHYAGVQDLTPENFDSIIDGSKPALVEFYAPWCGHCKRLAADYGKLGEAVLNSKANVVVAKVNADEHRDLGGRFEVKGFPTIKFFPKGSTTPEEYKGGRSAEDFIDFLNKNAGTNIRVKKDPSAVVDASDSDFADIVLNNDKDVLVEFYAPWCGHCKKLAPEYEKVAAAFKSERAVSIVKIDADKYKSSGSKYGVSGFPTLKFFAKGHKNAPVDYEGPRTAAALIDYVNSKAGTERVLGGGLNDKAGRVESLDALAASFLSSEAPSALVEQAEGIAKELEGSETAQYYVRAMKKGAQFIEKEKARLGKMLAGSLNAAKADEIKRKLNVLNAF